MKRAFTLMELLVAILIIFVLMGLLIVGIRHVRALAKGERDAQVVRSLKMAVDNFKAEVGFLPPLVKDFSATNGPTYTNAGRNLINVYDITNANDAKDLRGQAATQPSQFDKRFSLSTIPYYLIGALEVESAAGSGKPIDGVAGLGFYKPRSDGLFEKSGRKFDPFYDGSKNAKAIYTIDAAAGRIVLRDALGVPIRYYRWLRGDPAQSASQSANVYNVPEIVGNPAESIDLRSADYAVVAAGPDGVFGDEAEINQASIDPALKKELNAMTWTDLASRVKVGGDPTNDPVLQGKVRAAARADNIVQVGAK